LADSIAGERAQLQSLRDAADLVIDTGSINTNQLRSRMVEIFNEENGSDSLRVSLVSFGYSNGIPRDVDLVFDCRFLPNPHWIDELRPLTGLDEPVSAYVLEQEAAQHFLNDVVPHAGVADSGIRERGQVLPLDRDWLHRGTSPFGGDRRRDSPAPQSPTRSLSPRYRSMKVVAVGGGHGTAVSLRACGASRTT
jgi:hypothetical protein